VIGAVRDAATKRLTAWGQAYSDDTQGESSSSDGGTDADRVRSDRDEVQRRLQEMATAPMSAEDRRTALSELLALAEAIERGIDEVSDRLQATLDVRLTGHSPDRHVTVSITGGGEVTAVRFDRVWLRQAHELNIGRQITAAFRAAYEQVAAHGVDKLIADSALGEVQRTVQDPFGLARRLRLTD
jgi:DNA-binding protein YbaB